VLIKEEITRVVIIVNSSILIVLIVTVHLAKNLNVGGRLLRFKINNNEEIDDVGVIFSVDFCSSISFIIKITAVQYILENISKMVNLICLLVINHLLLKTEDNARIVMILFLFIISIDGKIEHRKMNVHRILLINNAMRIIGISFCHVIKIKAFLFEADLITSTNQRCIGYEASFMAREVIKIISIVFWFSLF